MQMSWQLTVALAASATFTPVVIADTVSDNFGVSHDYKQNGVAGTVWDGLLNAGNAVAVDANISSPDSLAIALNGGNVGWDSSHHDGPTLYKSVVGDFTASVRIDSASSTANYLNGGLIILDPTNSANFIAINHDTFVNGSHPVADDEIRNEVAGSDTNTFVPYDSYVEITRVGSAFNVYGKAMPADQYSLLAVINRSFSNNVEVGLTFGNYSSSSGTVTFGSFAVSGPNVGQPTVTPLPSSALGGGVLFAVGGLAEVYRRRRRFLPE